jgi:murein DD-endopeptidase MepM/ murein hydrolase activator NlpD
MFVAEPSESTPQAAEQETQSMIANQSGFRIGWRNIQFSGAQLAGFAPVCVLGLLLFSLLYVHMARPMQLYINGVPAIMVKDEAQAQTLLETVKAELAARFPDSANLHFDAELTYSKSGVESKAESADESEIREVLKDKLDWKVDAAAIQVNQAKTAVLASTEEAETVLDTVKKTYLPSGAQVTLIDAEFVEPVEIVTTEASIKEIETSEAAVKLLVEGKEKIEDYVLKEGDSLWSVAAANDTSVEALQAANPEAKEKTLQIGQVLKLAKAEPMVSVKTVINTVNEEKIPFDTVYEKDSSAYKGQQSVVKAGTEGKKSVTYEIAQVNGVELERKVISETVLAKPVDKIVKTGTKTIVASRGGGGSGILAWPIRGRINSPYGRRSRGYHTGIDIDADKGDPVYSAGAGTVTFASYTGGYGNCVIIDHGDGLSTRYAHLSKISVSVGQSVGRSELIGLAGSTGNSTGPHLHFEVMVNGVCKNPLNYLN